jgi:hypothetical protein
MLGVAATAAVLRLLRDRQTAAAGFCGAICGLQVRSKPLSLAAAEALVAAAAG